MFAATVPLMAAYREATADRGPVTLLKPKVKASKLVGAVAAELTARIAAALEPKKEVA